MVEEARRKNIKDFTQKEQERKLDKQVKEALPKELKRPAEEVQPEEEAVEKVIAINRTTKVTKGGRTLCFNALVVVGNKNGSVGFGYGKANGVPEAIKKGINDAKSNIIKVPLKGGTIPHEVIGQFGAAKVLLKPASEGTGVIAGSAVRAICDAAGIKNVLSKCLKSHTPANVIKAAMNGLSSLKIKEESQLK